MPAIRNYIIHFFYTNILKPIFFLFDPETVHDRMINLGKFLGSKAWGKSLTRGLFFYSHQALEQKILGINFKNPVGLAAGFDKNAELTGILPHVGFGFEEAGSITGEPCPGNAKPRLWRLKKSKSLLVYYGLKNDGCEAIAQILQGRKFNFPLGISIAKTNSPSTVSVEEGINDYAKAYKTFQTIGDYCTINISCHNAFGGEPFSEPERLSLLLDAINKLPKPKPIFLKMPAELPFSKVDEIIGLARQYKIDGFVCTNLAKDRHNNSIKDENFPNTGGMSGKVVEELADGLIKYIYGKTRGEFVIMGCGGIFSAEDAYRKIKLGASLLQLITGMIYEGPQLISDINRGLVEYLKQDGYKNISEAVGEDN